MKGVKYISPCRDRSGYGEASRNYIMALHKQGIPLTLQTVSFEPDAPPIDNKECREVLDSLEGKPIDYDVVIVHLTPDLAPQFALKEKNKYVISLTVWETSLLHPDWVKALNVVDEVWTSCEWNVNSFRNSGVNKPIYKMPHGIDVSSYEKELDQFSVGNIKKENTFVFYSIFQWNYRKNPTGLLHAYFNAFGPQDNVALVMKTYVGMGLGLSEEKIRIRKHIEAIKKDFNLPYYPKIYVVCETLSGEQMKGLHSFGDAYVSLTRGEGFGLPLFEAGLAGKPVISPIVGGQAEYLTEDNSFPVEYDWTYVSNMSNFNRWYLGNQQWVEPNLISAAEKMKYVYDHRKEAFGKGSLLSTKIKSEFGWDKIIEPMIKRLEEI